MDSKISTKNASENNANNRKFYTVGLFWNGNTTDMSMDNFSILDERDDEHNSSLFYMSFYRTRADAENGYNRWHEKKKKRFEYDVKMLRKFEEMGVKRNYPSVFKQFLLDTRFFEYVSEDGSVNIPEGAFYSRIPKAHLVSEKSIAEFEDSFKNFKFDDSMFEDGELS